MHWHILLLKHGNCWGQISEEAKRSAAAATTDGLNSTNLISAKKNPKDVLDLDSLKKLWNIQLFYTMLKIESEISSLSFEWMFKYWMIFFELEEKAKEEGEKGERSNRAHSPFKSS